MNEIASWKRFETVTELAAGSGQGFAPLGLACASGTPAAPSAALGRAAPDPARPLSVPGPLGASISLETLPPPDTRRWVVRRKAEVLAAINGGLITAAEACARYRLSPEELDLWQESLDRAGVPGLRVTRIQLYRDYDPVRETTRSARTAGPTGSFNPIWTS